MFVDLKKNVCWCFPTILPSLEVVMDCDGYRDRPGADQKRDQSYHCSFKMSEIKVMR